MNFKFKKIDAIIVIALIVIAGLVLSKAGYILPPPPEPLEPSDEH